MLSNIEKLEDGTYTLSKDGKNKADGDEDEDVEAEAAMMACGPRSGACAL
eukprot:CAMPEP_0185601958 /NCGR_PEP_ID=MMETSP0436-20130131/1436_1 /TAXON_ID=626734 ORGANISM="Favella taraikaensis, Strain Fe Narragansett Bay" /NCGR_SAMPLE_ID=MMETSP0436 /ASSEMBLY_ACC=CAM_ASM_000390 /LENGTH=49 /DNA_ID=CAMNT_0028232011 /DNA_START=1282 /DNA_END=1431 /DNA_ORIENTATION=-